MPYYAMQNDQSKLLVQQALCEIEWQLEEEFDEVRPGFYLFEIQKCQSPTAAAGVNKANRRESPGRAI